MKPVFVTSTFLILAFLSLALDATAQNKKWTEQEWIDLAASYSPLFDHVMLNKRPLPDFDPVHLYHLEWIHTDRDGIQVQGVQQLDRREETRHGWNQIGGRIEATNCALGFQSEAWDDRCRKMYHPEVKYCSGTYGRLDPFYERSALWKEIWGTVPCAGYDEPCIVIGNQLRYGDAGSVFIFTSEVDGYLPVAWINMNSEYQNPPMRWLKEYTFVSLRPEDQDLTLHMPPEACRAPQMQAHYSQKLMEADVSVDDEKTAVYRWVRDDRKNARWLKDLDGEVQRTTYVRDVSTDDPGLSWNIDDPDVCTKVEREEYEYGYNYLWPVDEELIDGMRFVGSSDCEWKWGCLKYVDDEGNTWETPGIIDGGLYGYIWTSADGRVVIKNHDGGDPPKVHEKKPYGACAE